MKNSYNGKAIPSEGKPIGYSEFSPARRPSIPSMSGCRATRLTPSGIFA